MKYQKFHKLSIAAAIANGVCTGLAVYSAIKETPRAMELLESLDENAKKSDKVIATMIGYRKTILFTAAAYLSCILSCVSGSKATSMAFGMYALATQYHNKYREILINRHGEEIDKDVMFELQRYNPEYHQIGMDSPDQKVRFYEPLSGTMITAYEREIMDAEYHINRNFCLGGSIAIEDYLMFFGIEQKPRYEHFGWDMAGGYMWLDFFHLLKHDEEGPYYEIECVFSPDELDYMF